jgi:hypothetical protein
VVRLQAAEAKCVWLRRGVVGAGFKRHVVCPRRKDVATAPAAQQLTQRVVVVERRQKRHGLTR